MTDHGVYRRTQARFWALADFDKGRVRMVKVVRLACKKYQAYHGSRCDINITDSWSKPLNVCTMCQVLRRYKLLFRDAWDRHNDGYFASNVGSLFA